MKKIDVNEMLAWLGGGTAAGAAFARQYFGSERSLLIGDPWFPDYGLPVVSLP